MSDSEFTRAFSIMIGGFTVLTLIIILLAATIGGSMDAKLYAAGQAERDALIAERLAPAGTLNVGEAPAAAAAAPEPTAAPSTETAQQTAVAAAPSGRDTYESSCAACHGTGVAGAPMLGDAAAWADRVGQGADVLYGHAISGYQGSAGYMPPKGGNPALSDDAVKAAVDYMTEQVK